MAVNTQGKLEITDLDFDTIKDNLKTYLKGQSEFTDYNFEGSGLSVLLDTLAYNTHYNAFMANMAANEMFLDTAVKRNSVISHAKAMGYTPVSVKAPAATVDVTVNDANTASLTLYAGHVFVASAGGVSYQFVNIADTTIQASDTYTFSGLKLYEGTWTETKYTVNISDADQKFILENNNVDISTLLVTVQTSSSDSTTTTYTKANNLVNVTSTSTVYFTQETTNGEWEIYFGDGVLGKALIDGNIISIKYVVTNKDAANGATTFTSSGAIGSFTDITIATTNAASGGADAENIGSIQHNAPFNYAAQNRAVTANDYKALVPTLYSNISSIAVWGGEYADPAVYGKVYISIKTPSGNNLTAHTKETIKTLLADYTVASITPEFVDPVTLKIIPVVNFKYNPSVTTKSNTALITLVTTAINSFSDDELEKFEGLFRYSKFQRTIDDADNAILSNITTLKISQTITPSLAAATKYTVAFNNALLDPDAGAKNVESTGFTITGNNNGEHFLDDDGEGNIRTYYFVGTTKVYETANIGTINYSTGEIVLSSFNVASVTNSDDTITITVIPNSNDIVPVRNQVLEIDATNLAVTGISDTIAQGSSNAGVSYTTTSSYN
tara:strand:+ start:803 stop:2641 length:1839 start_codon:yes stop_codon:yes gene_type:complete